MIIIALYDLVCRRGGVHTISRRQRANIFLAERYYVKARL